MREVKSSDIRLQLSTHIHVQNSIYNDRYGIMLFVTITNPNSSLTQLSTTTCNNKIIGGE